MSWFLSLLHMKVLIIVSCLSLAGITLKIRETGPYRHQVAAQSNQVNADESVLERKVSISVSNASSYEIIQELRAKYHLPISFIAAEKENRVTIEVANTSLRSVFERILSQNPTYHYRFISRRLVLYPKLPQYSFDVTNLDIPATGRLDAANKYVAHLKREFTEFTDLIGPPVKGYSQAPLYTQTVSLRKESTVIEHFVQLLGDKAEVVFSLIRARSGVPVLFFEEV